MLSFDASSGTPVAPATSTTALSDIMSNPGDNKNCPAACFRPVGLAWDSLNRLWMTSDSTGEIYVLQKQQTASSTATASGSIVTATGSAKSGATGGSYLVTEKARFCYGMMMVVTAVLVML